MAQSRYEALSPEARSLSAMVGNRSRWLGKDHPDVKRARAAAQKQKVADARRKLQELLAEAESG